MLNQKQIFPSKKGFVIYIPLIILFVIEVLYLRSGSYTGAICCFVIMASVYCPVFFSTHYTINANGILRVKCSWLINYEVTVANIRKIENTRTLLSAPALSLDRIEIFYNKFDTIIVSPKHKADFITALKKINPAISYYY